MNRYWKRKQTHTYLQAAARMIQSGHGKEYKLALAEGVDSSLQATMLREALNLLERAANNYHGWYVQVVTEDGKAPLLVARFDSGMTSSVGAFTAWDGTGTWTSD